MLNKMVKGEVSYMDRAVNRTILEKIQPTNIGRGRIWKKKTQKKAKQD